MAVLLDHFVAATAVEKRMALRKDEEAALRRRVRRRGAEKRSGDRGAVGRRRGEMRGARWRREIRPSFDSMACLR